MFWVQSYQDSIRGKAAVVFHKAALYELCAATFPLAAGHSPCATPPKAFPISHFPP